MGIVKSAQTNLNLNYYREGENRVVNACYVPNGRLGGEMVPNGALTDGTTWRRRKGAWCGVSGRAWRSATKEKGTRTKGRPPPSPPPTHTRARIREEHPRGTSKDDHDDDDGGHHVFRVEGERGGY